MHPFPELVESSYIKTRRQIHSVAGVLGKFRESLVKPIAKNDNLFLTVVEQGFCTPPMNDLNELEIGCNLEKSIVEVADSRNKYKSIEIAGKTQSLLSSEILSVLSDDFEIKAEIDSSSFDNSKTFELSGADRDTFLIQFINYAKLLSDFRKSVNGVKTQICLWPHSFDNAFRWFSGRKIDELDEQIGIGVSNGDETYELPYVYMTLSPPLRKTNTLQIPEGAMLHDYEWTGIVLPYESVAEKKDIDQQEQLIKIFFEVSLATIQRGFTKR